MTTLKRNLGRLFMEKMLQHYADIMITESGHIKCICVTENCAANIQADQSFMYVLCKVCTEMSNPISIFQLDYLYAGDDPLQS